MARLTVKQVADDKERERADNFIRSNICNGDAKKAAATYREYAARFTRMAEYCEEKK